jgi:large subunit ribosomal protein L22
MEARLKNAKISYRKMNLAAKMVRKMSVSKADVTLKFAMKKSAFILRKVINSAAANAGQRGTKITDLIIKEIFVGPGTMMKRYMPKARGNAGRILRRSSNILVRLATKDQVDIKKKAVKLETNILKAAEQVLKQQADKVTNESHEIFKHTKEEISEKKIKSESKKIDHHEKTDNSNHSDTNEHNNKNTKKKNDKGGK